MLFGMTWTPARLVTFSYAVALAACSSAPASGGSNAAPEIDAAPPDAPATSACSTAGETKCDGTRVVTCVDGAWSLPAECPGVQSCRDDTCQEPTAAMLSQAESIDTFLDTLGESSAWHLTVDITGAKTRERRAILKGDGTDATFFGAAWRALNTVPQGHQSLYADKQGTCGKTLAWQSTSRFGVCGRPSEKGIAITFAKPGNKLGLQPGDVVERAGGDEGDAMFEAAYARPVCGGVFPAKSGRRHAGAASFFGNVPAGTTLVVRTTNGTTRDVVVPAQGDATPTDCTDPFGRNRNVYAEATKRPDGVAVIRLPSFFPWNKSFPNTTDEAELDAFIAAYQSEIVKVFDTVKDAPAIVWDARGNTGGITPVGLAIIGGFASARATNVSYCRTRVAGSSPPSFDVDRYAIYDVTPGGPFAYAGKVAIVTDGLAYSAGDYFPFAALRASDAIVVGSSSAGAYGGGRAPIAIAGPPSMTSNYDPTACFDASNDKPLEGAPPAPTIAVEYAASDLAAGRDPIVERAVQALGF